MRIDISNISLLAVIFGIFTLQNAEAQETTQTLLGGAESQGGFGAPMVKVSGVAGEPAVWVGGRGSWLINIKNGHSISIGGGGYGLATRHEAPDADFGAPGEEHYADIGYGGFELEYYNRSNRLVHYTISTMIGGGKLNTMDENDNQYSDDRDSFFVFEPAVNLELNLTSYARVSLGISYRFTNGIGYAGFDDADFSGPAGTVTLKFGRLVW
ncbi:MAG: hypothetical protein R3281_01690 [Balneolaceae bacterium]|nr:hypothetical protein [Balneolaceae bacterium]